MGKEPSRENEVPAKGRYWGATPWPNVFPLQLHSRPSDHTILLSPWEFQFFKHISCSILLDNMAAKQLRKPFWMMGTFRSDPHAFLAVT